MFPTASVLCLLSSLCKVLLCTTIHIGWLLLKDVPAHHEAEAGPIGIGG